MSEETKPYERDSRQLHQIVTHEMQPTLEQAQNLITSLVKDYEHHRRAYLLPEYSEIRVRDDFIDKFFTALGWDVLHRIQKNPFEQEVKVEPNVSVDTGQRRADYAFYVAPNFRDVRFYAEAKKPFGALATKDNYFQTIRYGWNSRTPIAVLTNFEELHVLDCRYKPDIDRALSAAIKTYRYRDYTSLKAFSEIYYLLSRDAVRQDSLEKCVAALPNQRGELTQQGPFATSYPHGGTAPRVKRSSCRESTFAPVP